MIKKFQQGGGILTQIQQLPKEQQQQIMQAFSQWAQQKGVDINQLQQNPQALEQALGQFMQEMQSQKTQAMKHGSKLQYIKSLKNQCAEDEELYYYKKGGRVGCGCKKKEDGGQVEKASKGAIAQFKNAYNSKKKELNNKIDQAKQVQAKKKRQAEIDRKSQEDYEKGWTNEASAVNGKKCGGKVKKDACGSKVEKNCGGSAIAKFKASCGKKLKKNQQGGTFFLKK